MHVPPMRFKGSPGIATVGTFGIHQDGKVPAVSLANATTGNRMIANKAIWDESRWHLVILPVSVLGAMLLASLLQPKNRMNAEH